MNICLYTIDMYQGVERLMPWRTLVEVARYMDIRDDMSVVICSAQDYNIGAREHDSITIHSIPKGLPCLVSYLKENKIDVLYYPVAFRDAYKPLELLYHVNCKKIAYIPGGIYSIKGIAAFCFCAGIKFAKPYILERIIPHSLLISKLKNSGFTRIISFSQITQQNVIQSGWPLSQAILAIPGLDDFNQYKTDYSRYNEQRLQNKKFILYSGAPASIRGSLMLLKAFDIFAEEENSIDLVMLMRQDLSSDFELFNHTLNRIKHHDRVFVSYDKLSPNQLKAFFEAAYVVALPFLLVPSEIPLTFFEVLSCGTPVITFDNGGTSYYIKKGAIIVKNRTPKALALGLSSICKNSHYRDYLSIQAVRLMETHPSWEEFAQKWVESI